MGMIALGIVLAVAAGEASERRVAVTNLEGLGLDDKIIAAFERYLETSIGTIEGISTISSIDVEIALQDPRNEALRNCGGRERIRCAAALGRYLGADTMVYGTIGAIGSSYSVNLRAVDVSNGQESAKHSATISGSRDQLIPEVRLAAFKLIAPDKIFGTLTVDIEIAGVAVEVDGKDIGTTPLPNPAVPLPPGPHVIVLRRPGFKEFQREFEIEPFETSRLELQLEMQKRE